MKRKIQMSEFERQARARRQTHQVLCVREGTRLVDVVDAPDQTAFGISPRPKVLDMQIADRENLRRIAKRLTDGRPDLQPTIERPSQKGERVRRHLAMLELHVRSDH